jgi:hypothetical protein
MKQPRSVAPGLLKYLRWEYGLYFLVQQAWGSPAAAFLQHSGSCATISSAFLQQSAFLEGSAFEALQQSPTGALGSTADAQHFGTWAFKSAVFLQQAAISDVPPEDELLHPSENMNATATPTRARFFILVSFSNFTLVPKHNIARTSELSCIFTPFGAE